MDGTLDLTPHGPLRIKFARAKNFAQHWAHLVIVFANLSCDRFHDVGGRIVISEKAPDFACEEGGASGLFHEDIDDVVALPRTGLTHKSFQTVIVLPRSETKLLRCHIDAVARERSSGFADIFFVVVTDADREEFHQLARPIFVWVFFAALLKIEINHHRRVARHLFRDRSEISERVTSEHVVLEPHPVAVFHFLHARGEMAVPEQSHFLEERRLGRAHALEPPTTQIENILAFHFAEFAALFHRLAGLLFRSTNLAADFLKVARLRPTWRGRNSSIAGFVHQLMDRRAQPVFADRFDFFRRATEPCAI